MNPLSSFLPPGEAVTAYKRICGEFAIDNMIFEAMAQVAHARGFNFATPGSQAEHPRKHREIESLVGRYQSVLGREGMFLHLVEALYSRLRAQGQTSLAQKLLDLTAIRVAGEFDFRLSADGAWVVEWGLPLNTDAGVGGPAQSVSVVAYQDGWGQIVPWEVVQYLRSGILLFHRKLNATALAVMSIAVEATLRDILFGRGYTFQPGASRVNIYSQARAAVGSDGNAYTITMAEPVPQPVANLVASVGPLPLEVQIKRVEKQTGRTDLLITCPPGLLDHFSPSTVVQAAATHSIGGLGEALTIARDVERIIDAVDLPLDVDDVIKALRNNLIHFSSNSLDVVLPRFAAYSPAGQFTLRDFLNNANMVLDLVSEIPRFVSEQYVRLWQAGVRI